jgi:hypothetical protein
LQFVHGILGQGSEAHCADNNKQRHQNTLHGTFLSRLFWLLVTVRHIVRPLCR